MQWHLFKWSRTCKYMPHKNLLKYLEFLFLVLLSDLVTFLKVRERDNMCYDGQFNGKTKQLLENVSSVKKLVEDYTLKKIGA